MSKDPLSLTAEDRVYLVPEKQPVTKLAVKDSFKMLTDKVFTYLSCKESTSNVSKMYVVFSSLNHVLYCIVLYLLASTMPISSLTNKESVRRRRC